MELFEKAIQLLKTFKGDNYRFGIGQFDIVGEWAAKYGKTALTVASASDYNKKNLDRIMVSLLKRDVQIGGGRIVPNAAPNAPREDVYRIASYILQFKPDCIITIGGGSSIDAAKASNVLAALGEYSLEIDSYFGTGLVTQALQKTGRTLLPLIAVQTVAGSGAHLTKYSNITNPVAGQKKLIVDDAIIPDKAIFDYTVTENMPLGLTIDGALDGISHCLEVFYGATPEKFDQIKEIALTSIELIINYTKDLICNPKNLKAREALGLATDLGGYAIMVGGTNGAHLTSFSLVDLTSHGRACGIMNPYYTVFFAPVIEKQLRLVGEIYRKAGFIKESLQQLKGKDLGMAVAEGMKEFNRSINSPTRLLELPGFSDEHIKRALAAAKDQQLEMKLKNMPVPLNSSLIDEYMNPILEAAKTGDLSLIKNMA